MKRYKQLPNGPAGRQQDGSYPAHDNITKNRRPATRVGPGMGNLPSIIDSPTDLVSPVTRKPDAGLTLNIKAQGIRFPPTILQMAQSAKKKRLSFDTSFDRIGKASKECCPSYPVPSSVVKEHLRTCQPAAVPILSAAKSSGHMAFTSSGEEEYGSSHPHCIGGPPAVKGHHRTLPPIGPPGCGGVCSVNVLEDEDNGLFDSFESACDGNSDDGFIDTVSEAPPTVLQLADPVQSMEIPFPNATMATLFPATLCQVRAFQEMQCYTATVNGSGLCSRVNNIVRAYEIYGQLDKLILVQAIDKIVSLHPLLLASFSWVQGKLHVQTRSQGQAQVDLDVPVVGHEQPEDLILNARRKLFLINYDSPPTQDGDSEGLFSLTNINSTSTNQPTTLPVHSMNPAWMKVASCADGFSGNVGDGNKIRKKGCSFRLPAVTTSTNQQLSCLPSLQESSDAGNKSEQPLIRAKLVAKSSTKHILVLSFPRIVCDFWSSCLFMQQLVDAYGRLERNASYRPCLKTSYAGRKRGGVMGACQQERWQKNFPEKRQERYQNCTGGTEGCRNYVPMFPARLKFEQVAQREKQLLMMVPCEKLFTFWEAVVTTTVRRAGKMKRIKIVPPIRIPSGLGEVLVEKSSHEGRPQTSRLRPRTAFRNRPMLGRQKIGKVLGDEGMCREALLGPKTKFHFIKIEDGICVEFDRLLPSYCQNSIQQEDQFYLFTLAVYILLLAQSCRGWGRGADLTCTTSIGADSFVTSAKLGTSVGRLNRLDSSDEVQFSTMGLSAVCKQVPSDNFEIQGRNVEEERVPLATVGESSPKLIGERRQDRLDVGTFLVGVEVSHRNGNPSLTEGLFGPLTNDVAIRVSLSSSETFSNLLADLSRSLQLARKHGHHPFEPVAEQFGLAHGLPVKFSYLRHHEVIQLANPNEYFYIDTAVGVVDKGLARMGANCYLTPLNSKLDDYTHLELVLWESYDFNNSLAGGLRYQPHIIRTDLVQAFGAEFCRLLAVVASEPSISLMELAAEIRSPFLSNCSKLWKRKKIAL